MRNKNIKLISAHFLYLIVTLFFITSFRYYSPNEIVAIEFLNSLNPEQRDLVVLKFDNESREEWTYLPVVGARDGLLIKNLTDEQKNLLHELLKKYLSVDGYNKTKSIIELESILREIPVFGIALRKTER